MRLLLKLLSPFIAIALVTSSCGGSERVASSSSSETNTSSSGTQADDSQSSSAQETDESNTEEAETQTTADAEETPEPEPEVPSFGDLEWPCGPGTATGTTDQGVTDEAFLSAVEMIVDLLVHLV